MGFNSMMKNELGETFNNAFTDNGALVYKTSGKHLLDMNFNLTGLRKSSDSKIVDTFSKVFYEDKKLAIKYLFYVRDAREGVGERRIFRVCMNWLAINEPEYAKAVLNLIAEYGRYDDMLVLLDTNLKNDVLVIFKKQLTNDVRNVEEGKPISLLAKWIPSINTSSKETRRYASIICKGLGLTERTYRKTLSKLRAYLKVTEVQVSANQWNEIDYNIVPSQANLKYKNAFLKHDEERRREWLGKFEKGDKSVKINANVLTPVEIVGKYDVLSGYSYRSPALDQTLEELWKALPTKTIDNVMVVRDGSGSMIWGCNPVKPLDVATALAIYMSEHNTGEWKDNFITFSAAPKYIDLSDLTTLRDKLLRCKKEYDCSNTNIEKVFNLILHTAIANNLTQDDMPKAIVIVSDMQFDVHSHRYDDKLFNIISKEFQSHGYELPKLIFWNVDEIAKDGIPVKQNNNGVILISGYSTNLLNMVMSNEIDPFKALLEQINSERYQPVEEAIKELA